MEDKAETTGGAVGGIAGIALLGGAVQCSSGYRGDGAIDAVRRGEDAAGVWECGSAVGDTVDGSCGVWSLVLMLAPVNG